MNNKLFNTIFVLNRDVNAVAVPSGAKFILHKGCEVRVMQHLGDTISVSFYGNLARIYKKDSGALGKEASDVLIYKEPEELNSDSLSIDEKVWERIKRVYDPEIPVNVVDLGLIYNVRVKNNQIFIKKIFKKLSNAAYEYVVYIEMTLTAPGCGMGDVIMEDVKFSVMAIKEVVRVEVKMVFDPLWSKEMMSDAARLELGML